MKKTLILLVGLLIVGLLVAGCSKSVEIPTSPETPTEDSNMDTTTGDNLPTANEDATAITQTELATHNDDTSCWVAFKGEVYDLTAWLNQHPGGKQAILPHCGTAEQFEQAYTQQHGNRDELRRNPVVGPYAG